MRRRAIKIKILNPKQVVYEGDAESVFLPGDHGEFEILDYHVPVVSLLSGGDVIVDWKRRIPIRNGMVKFDRNECVVLMEE